MIVPKKKQKKNIVGYKIKFFVSLLSLAGLFVGLAFIIKAVLEQYPLNISSKNDPQVQGTQYNEYTTLDSVDLKPINTVSTKFGVDITSSFTPLIDQKVYLRLQTETENIVGFINDKNEFKVIYKIKGDIEDLKLYNDESIAYVAVNSFGARALNVANSKENGTFYQFDLGILIKSFYFEPVEKSFYVLLATNEGETILGYIDSRGSYQEIFKTTLAEDFQKLNNVELQNNRAFLTSDKGCYAIDFITKKLSSANCNLIRNNPLNKNLSDSAKDLSIIDIDSTKSAKIDKNNKKFTHGILLKDRFIFSEQDLAPALFFELKQATINENLETNISSLISGQKIEAAKLVGVFIRGSDIYIIVNNPDLQVRLYKPLDKDEKSEVGSQNSDNVEETQNEELDNEENADETEKKVDVFKDWLKIDLGTNLLIQDIEILNSNPNF